MSGPWGNAPCPISDAMGSTPKDGSTDQRAVRGDARGELTVACLSDLRFAGAAGHSARPMRPDRYELYEAAVQDVDFDLGLFRRVYRRLRGTGFTRLREDFCGTARLAATWVERGRDRRAWAVDLNPRPLAWARRNHVPAIGDAARRLRLLRADVNQVRTPRVDVVAALNCSYWVFKRRAQLLRYFRRVRRSLAPGGLLFLDAFGGEGAMRALIESRRMRGSRNHAGGRVPPFTYVWEQKSFNPLDHHLRAAIHFRLGDGQTLRNAFTYDWRMWGLPELDEGLREAGFADVHVYVQAWDDERNQPLNIYRRRGRFENQEAWLAYIVGVR
jgi:SAM-dependent methyltransferase